MIEESDEKILPDPDIPKQFREDMTEPSTAERPCPHCGQAINEEVIRCLYCGEMVAGGKSGFMPWLRTSMGRDVAALIAILILISILGWLF
ncbi:MAG: hypothetical protein JW937_03335 [Candidatus Omnitrophica bacterium]|nr:hypothetical protein [Candidatus Omnitrophota bacterium]